MKLYKAVAKDRTQDPENTRYVGRLKKVKGEAFIITKEGYKIPIDLENAERIDEINK